MKLHFHAKDLLPLLQHTRDAESHDRLYDDPETEKPGLWIVGDDGVYFMSNGIPILPKPGPKKGDGDKPSYVVHAVECDPKTNDDWYDVKRASFGNDDGGIFIPIEELECLTGKFTVIFTAKSVAIEGMRREWTKRP